MGTVYAKTNISTTLQHHPIETKSDKKQDINEIVLSNVNARVDRIHVDGLSRTKDDIIHDCLNDLFKARTFQDILLKSHETRLKLAELNCFKDISIYIDTSKGTNATPDGYEVTFNVKEYKRITGGISTQVGNNEAELLVGLKMPNLFGRGERIQFECTYGNKGTINLNGSYIKPVRGKYRPTFTTSIFQSHAQFPASSYKLLDRGILLDFGFYLNNQWKHNLQFEGLIRDLNVLGKSASFNVREHSGTTLKSAIKYLISLDKRDDIIFPTTGNFIKLTNELAGLGGNIGYLKHELFLQTNTSILNDYVFQLSGSAGIMRQLDNEKTLNLADMYYLGGPMNLRGFQMRGVGPRADGDAIGATIYGALGVHLFVPLPFRPGRGSFGDLFRLHYFLTAGNVTDLTTFNPDKFLNDIRMSYGLGLALRLGNIARLELNYCLPYFYEKTDRIHPGIQIGIGIEFL